ncbi:TRAP-T-associated universal stress protein TeaD [Fundidesulfovibrio magnetotacticus]|uniref:TRAP-T-associated universal stress protein TeaD n=1 Tax=Fundidesulfovibrio magnetotacticus TaxID=2730080 RepID=A0A6V8LKK1_9BACT|nr:universal stress protein [Fundidesulfovibrio magnetotacticus]GFK93223.1 TRAP-T-associated universal stress protein TeaD [Fundidesulfovibrio magnetotacticus]
MQVLVAHDGSPQAGKALEEAARIASKFSGGITIVTVAPDVCMGSEELSPEECSLVARSLSAEAEARARKAAQSLKAKGIEAQVLVRAGRPPEQIVEAARETGADLIVIGSVGRHGAARLLLGSVSSRVAELADVNVLIVK